MIDVCKEHLFTLYNPEEKKGLFFSGFDANKKLLVSQGVVETDRPLRELTEELYTKVIEPVLGDIRYIVLDVVTDIIAFPDAKQILELDPRTYGFVVEDLEDEYVGVILPNIAGVTDTKQVLYDLKKKHNIHGKAAVSGFTTERIVIPK